MQLIQAIRIDNRPDFNHNYIDCRFENHQNWITALDCNRFQQKHTLSIIIVFDAVSEISWQKRQRYH